MRPTLFQKPSPRRSGGPAARRLGRGVRRSRHAARQVALERDPAIGTEAGNTEWDFAAMGRKPDGGELERDPAVRRARDAGGPEDQATYVCGCGYLFSASVSTTVACPHCGCRQAW